jgi:hypothetical protein
LNNDTLDGIPLTEHEKSMIRLERDRIRAYYARQEKQEKCNHDFSRYLGHGHNDEAYECVHCGKVKYV